jgi:mannan endo-1,4-beta-mannosidase
MGLPLVIGEFGGRFNPNEVDHETILAQAQTRGLGWLAWSWSGNNDPILDLTEDFDPGRLTTFGQRIVNGVHGLKTTAEEATVYSGTDTAFGALEWSNGTGSMPSASRSTT